MPKNDFALANNCYSTFKSSLSEYKTVPSAIPNNAFIICTTGSATIEINLEEYEIDSQSCLYLFANSLIRIVTSTEDFSCRILAFNKTIILDAMVGFETELLKILFQNPLVRLKDSDEWIILNNYYDILSTYSQGPEYGHHYDFVCGNIRCLIISLIYTLRRICGISNSTLNGYNTSDNYFRQFMKLLGENSRTQHDVAFYADELSITPKYLNEISRKKAHSTAKEVITQYVIAQIKRELILSGNPVQRIAYDFNFSDQSSFGKYFKKTVGMSPMSFRKLRLQQYDDSTEK